jgi:hypothetical protein
MHQHRFSTTLSGAFSGAFSGEITSEEVMPDTRHRSRGSRPESRFRRDIGGVVAFLKFP